MGLQKNGLFLAHLDWRSCGKFSQHRATSSLRADGGGEKQWGSTRRISPLFRPHKYLRGCIRALWLRIHTSRYMRAHTRIHLPYIRIRTAEPYRERILVWIHRGRERSFLRSFARVRKSRALTATTTIRIWRFAREVRLSAERREGDRDGYEGDVAKASERGKWIGREVCVAIMRPGKWIDKWMCGGKK